jgi:hypothetical protein
MPFQKDGKRDYKRELQWEKKKRPNRVKDRAQRNAARATVAKSKGVTPTQLKGDVGHKKAISKGGKNTASNLQVQDPGKNRSFARKANGAMKSETSKRERSGKRK